MTQRARPLERAPKGTEKMPSMTEREKIHRLFKDFERGGFAARNRFVRAATWLGCCAHETGELTQAAVSRTAEAAAGGAGTVVSEFAYVSREGRAATRQWGLDCDRGIGEVRRLAEAVHAHGSKLIVQICHAGGALDEIGPVVGILQVKLSKFGAEFGEPRGREGRNGGGTRIAGQAAARNIAGDILDVHALLARHQSEHRSHRKHFTSGIRHCGLLLGSA